MRTEDFDIHLFQLAEGEHELDFLLDDSFFALFEGSPVEHGQVKATVQLQRERRYLRVELALQGAVDLVCDRSLDVFTHPVEANHSLLYKMADEEAELEEDVFTITEHTETINLAQALYDYLVLSLPMRKLHPRFYDEDGHELPWHYEQEQADEPEQSSDPRWAALKNLYKDSN